MAVQRRQLQNIVTKIFRVELLWPSILKIFSIRHPRPFNLTLSIKCTKNQKRKRRKKKRTMRSVIKKENIVRFVVFRHHICTLMYSYDDFSFAYIVSNSLAIDYVFRRKKNAIVKNLVKKMERLMKTKSQLHLRITTFLHLVCGN